MMNQKKPSYQKPSGPSTTDGAPAKAKGARAPYNLTFSVGEELVRLTGLFENKSKAGNDYLGVKKIRSEDISKLIETLHAAQEAGTEVGVFVFENKPKA